MLPTNPPTGISVVIAYSNKVVFVRRAGALMRVSTVTVRPGDQIKLAGSSNVGCSAATVGGKPTIFCDVLDSKGNFAQNSYAFGIRDSNLTALFWNDKGKVSAVKSWRENG